MVSDRGNGVYRSIIATIVGLILAGSSPAPNDKATNQANQSTAKIERALDSISAAQNKLAEATKSGEYQAPCDARQPNYKSDLCAQWYAARAARDAADWAFWALVVGLVGAMGIVAALWLTIDSNRIARDTAKRQLRAYVNMSGFRIDRFLNSENKIEWKIQASWINAGQTPAISIIGGLRWQDFEWEIPSDFSFPVPVEGSREFGTIGPGLEMSTVAPQTLPDWLIRATTGGLRRTYVWGWVEYDDVFESRPRHRTECACEIVIQEINDGEVGMIFAPLNRHNTMDAIDVQRQT